MALSVGIIGLPNVGKSTLLNALSQCHAEASNYPFCTIEKNVGIAQVPDKNLKKLKEILTPEEALPTSIQFIDIAGLVEGAHKGEGLGNKFLSHVRETDALLQVVRCFADDNVAHVYAEPDPVRDAEVVETELLLADLKTAESWLERARKALRGGHKDREREVTVLTRCVDMLNEGRRVSDMKLSQEEKGILWEVRFLTEKPLIYLANVDEADSGGRGPLPSKLAAAKGAERVIPLAVKIEEEIAQLPEEEGEAFLEEMGLEETGLNRVILACYRILDLITFYTVANNKLRAWQLVKGSSAPEAAGKVHSDMEKGFIRAEVMALNELLQHGSRNVLIEKGLVLTVGRDYEVKDRDILQFHFKA